MSKRKRNEYSNNTDTSRFEGSIEGRLFHAFHPPRRPNMHRNRGISGVFMRSKHTKPEQIVKSWVEGHDLILHMNTIPGTPDIVLPKLKVAIFVDGRHWHDPKHAGRYKNKTDWVKKAAVIQNRDSRTNRRLRDMGWTVIRIWDDCTTAKWGQDGFFRLNQVLKMIKLSGNDCRYSGKTVRISRGKTRASGDQVRISSAR